MWKHKYDLLKQDFGNTKKNYEAELQQTVKEMEQLRVMVHQVVTS